MKRPVVYDVTRLVTRALNPTPNGIDRVDFALARHFLSGEGGVALAAAALGPRLAAAEAGLRTLDDIETYWNELRDSSTADGSSTDEMYERLVASLGATPQGPRAPRVARRDWAIVRENWRAMRRWALRLGRPPSEAPAAAVFFNASQFPVHKEWHLRWLDARPDVKPVFFVYDLLPLDAPEFFRPAERDKHRLVMDNIVRRAAGVVVASASVARRFTNYATEKGRGDLPVCVAGLPAAPAFERAAVADPRLADTPYFVFCSTIEPRKNHMLMLDVWRELAEREGVRAPKLVLVGKRGWHNQNVLRMLERCAALRPHVVEASGLSTPAMRRLLAGARAALAPSFAEGFGLPIAEAAACGAPIIASDIEIFREIADDTLDYIDPLDGLGWRDAILDYSAPDSPRRAAALRRITGFPRRDAASFFETIDEFLRAL
ncbi:hypothetical protein MSC49_25830 [Methylosinus sp. C49]|uniref:glycosyltransferase n=1 Tax=Methylosinus sp. C49 TaxID=2699395 RepID=UPI001366D296|nr:glycosyltransferase [Methylosinus sp. C49]BBU62648.1 hypothetical protein MSC49_25830 [Methylosinus sp. C49]